VELHGDKTFTLKQQKYRVSEALKTGEATVLFGACAPISYCLKSKYFIDPSRDFGIWKSPRFVYQLHAPIYLHTTRRFPLQITSPILSMPSLPQMRTRNRRGRRPNQTHSISNRTQYLWVSPSRFLSNKRRETRAFFSHGRKVSPQKMLLIRMWSSCSRTRSIASTYTSNALPL
jgi:hypothetical protein